jgi:hypothetical protein
MRWVIFRQSGLTWHQTQRAESSMIGIGRWSRILATVGLVAMVIGVIDPLEGSLIILPGTGLVALGALLGKSRHRKLLYWSFALVAIGVGALFGLSALGGFGGRSSLSYWWGLIILPYPVGWVMGIVGAIKSLRESPTHSVLSTTPQGRE